MHSEHGRLQALNHTHEGSSDPFQQPWASNESMRPPRSVLPGSTGFVLFGSLRRGTEASTSPRHSEPNEPAASASSSGHFWLEMDLHGVAKSVVPKDVCDVFHKGFPQFSMGLDRDCCRLRSAAFKAFHHTDLIFPHTSGACTTAARFQLTIRSL